MSEEFQFATNCLHRGAIKPVKSDTGKYAGKWAIRLKGPSTQKTRTLYCAASLSAAEAAIAKHLKISVDQVDVEKPRQADGTRDTKMQTPAGAKSTTPAAGEFDDREQDDELAAFDLDAAVNSARKAMMTPLAKKSPSNPYKKNLPPSKPPAVPKTKSTCQCCRELQLKIAALEQVNAKIKSQNVVLQKKARDEIELKAKVAALEEATAKLDTQNAALRQSRPTENELKAKIAVLEQESALSKAQNEKSKSALRTSEEGLQARITDLMNTNGKLRHESQSIRQTNEMLLEELSKANLKDQTKASTMATQKDSEALKSQLESCQSNLAAERKEKSEAEATAGRLQKELSFARAELNALQNKTADQAVTSEPPTKKRKAHPSKGGTVVKSMKVGELKEEAVARGMDFKVIAKMNKDTLLENLCVGSARLTKTDAWQEITSLRAKYQSQREDSAEKDRIAQEKERQREEEKWRRQEELRRQQEAERMKKLMIERAGEKASQAAKHTHSFPKVYPKNLAKSCELMLKGNPRTRQYTCCDICRHYITPLYTCEEDDFDICAECFRVESMSEKEKAAEAKRKAKEAKDAADRAARMREEREKAEEERQKKLLQENNFKPHIYNLSKRSLDPKGNGSKGWTVWCSDGYGNDGWHSYEGPPTKHFDSTFATREDANARAKYLFYWKNSYGFSVEEMRCQEVGKRESGEGLVEYTVHPDDSTTWTVAVVPDSAFPYLENTTMRRHCFDRDAGYGGSDDEANWNMGQLGW